VAPNAVDPASLDARIAEVRSTAKLRLGGKREIGLRVYFSVGGGFIVSQEEMQSAKQGGPAGGEICAHLAIPLLWPPH
jgi:hypothetical protein